jgi:site-specific DNA-methyltransferase (adenine-specific)
VTPYYEDDAVTIYNADARVSMASIPAVAIVTDPPYGDTALAWDTWPDGWVEQIPPTCRQVWSFGSMRTWLDRASEFRAAGWTYSQEIVWEKHNGSGFTRDRFKRVHEFAMLWYRGAWFDLPRHTPITTGHRRITASRSAGQHLGAIGNANYDSTDRLMRSVIYAKSAHGNAENETQKPEKIVEPLVRYSTNARDLILDPFMGSGTTLRVAKSIGRKAVGFDVREEQCEAAARRMSGQLDLRTDGAA